MKYKVVHSSASASGTISEKALNKLILEVNSLMDKGWQPVGGIDSSRQGISTFFLQAMIYRPAHEPPSTPG
jgi:hypothetical protein